MCKRELHTIGTGEEGWIYWWQNTWHRKHLLYQKRLLFAWVTLLTTLLPASIFLCLILSLPLDTLVFLIVLSVCRRVMRQLRDFYLDLWFSMLLGVHPRENRPDYLSLFSECLKCRIATWSHLWQLKTILQILRNRELGLLLLLLFLVSDGQGPEKVDFNVFQALIARGVIHVKLHIDILVSDDAIWRKLHGHNRFALFEEEEGFHSALYSDTFFWREEFRGD